MFASVCESVMICLDCGEESNDDEVGGKNDGIRTSGIQRKFSEMHVKHAIQIRKFNIVISILKRVLAICLNLQ